MVMYQNGKGPALTAEEFQQWQTDLERVVALRKHLSIELPLPPSAFSKHVSLARLSAGVKRPVCPTHFNRAL